ncbi:MAG: hypothetical protein KC496_02425, partial [Anaerolineae bacterium]|nr:hypothetical protein [Anaerolineae bacterium]
VLAYRCRHLMGRRPALYDRRAAVCEGNVSLLCGEHRSFMYFLEDGLGLQSLALTKSNLTIWIDYVREMSADECQIEAHHTWCNFKNA